MSKQSTGHLGRGANGSRAPNMPPTETLDAISASQAMIEFELDGTIVTANENFLLALGYELPEIVGQHHSIFVPPDFKESAEYRQFWDGLRAGRFQEGEVPRLHKSGKEIWFQATYNPVLGLDGKPNRVVKTAVDITEKKLAALENEAAVERLLATLESIGASQAMIEFEMDGKIITANENFLRALGYELPEIVGQHHSMFVHPDFRESAEYRKFWDTLKVGKFEAGEALRIRKDGSEVWFQAAYNPVLDSDGRPYKVVKTAIDITAKKKAALRAEATVSRQAQDILELSTPVISVWDGVLVLPLIGTVDSRRAQECMEGALTRLSSEKARVLILDITGVPVVDTLVANHLIGMASATRMMGGNSIITGISPTIAMTMIGLGIDLSSLHTRGTLAEGLKLAIDLAEAGGAG